MPFYLVTKTILIEADDQQAAALKAVNLIRAGDEIEVAVKADESNMTYVVVPRGEMKPESVLAGGDVENELKPAGFDENASSSLSTRIFSYVSLWFR